MAEFWPSTKPPSFTPPRNALTRSADSSGERELKNPITGLSGCWARTVNGHAIEAAIALMKSRRRIAFPKAGIAPIRTRLQQGFAIDEMGFRLKLHSSNREARMFALGHNRT